MAKDKGWLVTQDWRQYDVHYHSVVEYPGCLHGDIEAAIEEARRRKIGQLFRNPLVALRYAVKLYQLKGARGFAEEIGYKLGFILKSLRRRP